MNPQHKIMNLQHIIMNPQHIIMNLQHIIMKTAHNYKPTAYNRIIKHKAAVTFHTLLLLLFSDNLSFLQHGQNGQYTAVK